MSKPSIIVLFGSFRCNLRCMMCTAWQRAKDFPELKPADIAKIFSDRVLSSSIKIINLTGGEPTLRKDLPEIVKVLTERCQNLRRLDLSTNGVNTREVVDTIEMLLVSLLHKRIKLTVSVSVDGIGELHDRVRRLNGAFASIGKTITALKDFLSLYPENFSLGLNFTVNRLNCAYLQEAWEYSQSRALGMNFTLAAISDIGVDSAPLQQNFALDSQQRIAVSKVIKSFQENQRLTPRYGKFLLHWLEEGRRQGRCSFKQGISLLCEPDGSLYRCGNFKDFKIGNLLENSFSDMHLRRREFSRLYSLRCKTCNSNCYF